MKPVPLTAVSAAAAVSGVFTRPVRSDLFACRFVEQADHARVARLDRED
jgi:hypothetical protein